MSWAPDLDSQPWARALTWQGRAVTGPQFCGPRAPDIHALQAVIRTPAGLPGGRWPPCPPAPSPYLRLFFPVPVPCPFLTSLLWSLWSPTQAPNSERQAVGFQHFFSKTSPGSLPFPLRLLRRFSWGAPHQAFRGQRSCCLLQETPENSRVLAGEAPVQTQHLPQLCPV